MRKNLKIPHPKARGFTGYASAGYIGLFRNLPATTLFLENGRALPQAAVQAFVTAALEEPENVSYYRRGTPRAEPAEGLYAFWSCNGLGDLSRVRNLNLGGIFLETASQKELGAAVELHFLVSEGQISVNAIVRHVSAGKGIGLKFTTLEGRNRLRFGVLMKRLYAEDRATPVIPLV